MLDPLTCFSIACSVMQVISFSIEVTSIVKRIKKDGTADSELREHADNLSKASNGLEHYLKSCDLKHLPKNQDELQDIAMKCLQTSKAIQLQMDEIDSARGGRMMRALKMKLKKSTFERLEQAMQKYQETMQTHILVHLCNQNDAVALEREANFQSLDKVLQKFIKSYAEDQVELENRMLGEFGTTKALISAANEDTVRQNQAEHLKTQDYFAANQKTTESRRDHEAQMKQLLGSLDDKEMNARRNQVEKAHTETFSWVFDEVKEQPWDNFADWLGSDASLYWISGKAGSGKSTLMKFLINDKRTSQYLQKWAPGCSIYSHFIWSSGTAIQRSILGLLRSLVYQILEGNEPLIDNLLQKWPRISKIKYADDWSRDFLEEVLVYSLSLCENGVCVFVDGLDEIDPKDGPFDLLSLIKRISSPSKNKDLKVCVSSRPEASFKLGLEGYPKLKLHDLTKRDVEVYTIDYLRTKCSFNLSGIGEDEFIREIVTKSEGVFLWVSLALKSLQRGFINGDDPSKLMERLTTLPSELGKLYDQMLKRLGDDQDLYSKEAALFFNIYLFLSDIYNFGGWCWNLFHYAVAFDPSIHDMLLEQGCPSCPTNLKNALLDVSRKLASRCAGILEVVFQRVESETESIKHVLSRDESRPWRTISIELLHRSAKDFLLSRKHELLDQDMTSAAERKFRVLRAIALEDLFCERREPRHIVEIFNNTAIGIMTNTQPQLSDTEELNILNLIQEIDRRNGRGIFYEVAARNGVYHPNFRLLESDSGDYSSLRNYLLVCVLSKYTKRTHAMASHLLKRGADPNWIAVIPAYFDTLSQSTLKLYLPMPLLGFFLAQFRIVMSLRSTDEFIEEMIHLFLASGADIERKFLSLEWGGTKLALHSQTDEARPVYVNPDYFGYPGTSLAFLVEVNCIDLILADLVQSRSYSAVEKVAITSRLGLDTARAHHKILLCFYENTVYGVSDEDSAILNGMWDWPRSRMPEKDTVNSEEDGHGDSGNRGNRGLGYDSNPKYKNLVGKLEGWKRSEIIQKDNVSKWLSNRGYTLPERQDLIENPREASVHEMAAAYQRLNDKFG